MTAFKYDHDAEARRGVLSLTTEEPFVCAPGSHDLRIYLSQDEAIELYELLRSHWAGYVAERDEAKRDRDHRRGFSDADLEKARACLSRHPDQVPMIDSRRMRIANGMGTEQDHREIRAENWLIHQQGREPWKLRESVLEARAEGEDFSDFGYALDDPKHPTYHDRMVD